MAWMSLQMLSSLDRYVESSPTISTCLDESLSIFSCITHLLASPANITIVIPYDLQLLEWFEGWISHPPMLLAASVP